ncbi:MAG TPA: S41 family peptidase [Candidatus Synoicihabitans sp.]|nr:S41 family peptidase [Candidatus Synoicihabitans sp.]
MFRSRFLFSFWRRSRALVSTLVLAVAVSGCVAPHLRPPREPVYASQEARAEAQREVLEQVWQHVDRRFYARDFNGADWATARERYRTAAEQATSTEAFYDVLNRMLEELGDAHTAALTPQESWEEFTAARALVGLSLERLDDRWVVAEVRPGSAAERAGVRPGWIALSRNGEALPTQGISFLNVPGQEYRWTFLDEMDTRRTLLLTAETMADWVPPVEQLSPEGWVYLRFDGFETDYQRWLRTRLRAHRVAPGIILDLRQNGGGAVSSLERIINDFFPERIAYGTFVTRGGREDNERSAWFGGANYTGPLAVLIGEGSASSAEILAHVLKHYRRATLIGRPTAGVVIASQYFRLRDGGELQLGTYDFRTVDGSRLEGQGVQPDIVVQRTLAAVRAGRDPDLDAAVEWLQQQRRVSAARATAAADAQ